jgi:hypothetical protein
VVRVKAGLERKPSRTTLSAVCSKLIPFYFVRPKAASSSHAALVITGFEFVYLFKCRRTGEGAACLGFRTFRAMNPLRINSVQEIFFLPALF